jgi:PAS domain S-box-containing protein
MATGIVALLMVGETASHTARRSLERVAMLEQTTARLVEAVTRKQVADVLVRACDTMFGSCATSFALLDEAPKERELTTFIRDALRSADVVVEGTRAAVPLACRGHVLGVMGLDFEESPSFDEEELELLRTIGGVGAAAFERASLPHPGGRDAPLTPHREWATAELAAALHSAPVGLLEREAREKLRMAARDSAFVQATALIVWGTNAQGVVTEDSPSWRALTGMRDHREWLTAVHPDDRERVCAAWSRATESKSLYECEMRMRRHDGTYVWTVARGAPVLDEHGEVLEWVGTSMDISERKRAEEEREATLRFAEQFIGILGHDLRNPINAVQMAAQLLERKADSADDRRRLVERIAASTSRMSNMVSQLLDLTRVRLGTGLHIERKATNLSHVVTAAVDELRLAHPARTIECACGAFVVGSWDADRLAQIVSNLVGNALQHGDPARPVEVRVETTDAGAVFEVQSYGTPIAPNLLPHIFDPYRQGQSHSGKSKGLGLGLFITQQIVHAHRGQIGVRSTAAEGTRFTVRLPRD